MSDLPPPPGPSTPPPPPPPPPTNLVAPSGYAAYAGGHFGSVALKRASGLARASMILVGLTASMSFVDLAVRQTVVDEADAFLAGATERADFVQSILGYMMIGVVTGGLQLAAFVITVIWMWRVSSNHRALHRGGTWGPGWAIGGWFAPPIIYVIPTMMLREMWKASDPDVPIGGDWRSRPGSPLPVVWFVLYTIAPFVAFASEAGGVLDQLGGSERSIAEGITGNQTGDVVVALFGAAAAAAWIMLVRGITHRHRLLTGEPGR